MKARFSSVGVAVCALAWMLVILGGCSDSGTDEIFSQNSNSETSSVEGQWSFEALNEGSATLTGCSGDLSGMEGMSYAEFRSAGPSCSDPGAPVASQDGDVFYLSRVAFNCGGEVRTLEGSGTISGSQLTGDLDTSSDAGWMLRESISGSASGGSLSVSQSNVAYAQGRSGSCSLSPALTYAVTISAPEAGGGNPNAFWSHGERRSFD